MGRYVRSVIRGLTHKPQLALTLFVRDPHAASAYRDIAGDVEVAALAAARKRRDFAAVWYPWNGIRFGLRAPAVVTINDDFAFSYAAAGRIARWREQQPIRRAVKGASRILTISRWARHALIERFALDPQRVDLIPLGPDAFFTPGSEPAPYTEPFVLAVGTREERKNIAFLIDVFGRAFPQRNVRLVLVGTPDQALQQQIRRANILVSESSGINDTALRRLYRTATVVAVPSLAEGFGLVVAEAQACGAAVIAAASSALPEVVGDAGIICGPHDAHAWIAALRELVEDRAFNARFRARAAARWPSGSAQRTTDAVFAALQRAIDDGM